jgi:hypothetical protein
MVMACSLVAPWSALEHIHCCYAYPNHCLGLSLQRVMHSYTYWLQGYTEDVLPSVGGHQATTG